MLEAKTAQPAINELMIRLTQLEKEALVLKETVAFLRRQNEYLTAPHETSRGLTDRLDKEELLEAILLRAARLSGKKIQLFETRRLTKAGRVLDVQISSTRYHNQDGKPVGNIVILRDVSAPKKAEAADCA